MALIDVKLIRKAGNASSGTISSSSTGYGSSDYADRAGYAIESGKAKYADKAGFAAEASHAVNADNALKAKEAELADQAKNLTEDSPVWDKVLRKDQSDRTPHNLAIGGDLITEKDLRSKDFAEGLTGYGFRIDKDGNIEADSLTLRKFLEVPELRFNRTIVETGITWRAPGGGIVESVTPNSNGTGVAFLKLEEGEAGAVEVGDLAMGIYHFGSGDATADSDDRKGNFKFAGFTTIYFRVTAVGSDETGTYFQYQLRPGWPTHPAEGMHFACYGNPNNEDRRRSCYETRSYTRYLAGVTGWEFGPANIMMQLGDLSGLTVDGRDLTGYSAYLNNVFFTGTIQQIENAPLRLSLDTMQDPYIGMGRNCTVTCRLTKGFEDVDTGSAAWTLTLDSGASTVPTVASNGRFILTSSHLNGKDSVLVTVKALCTIDGQSREASASLIIRNANALIGETGARGSDYTPNLLTGTSTWENSVGKAASGTITEERYQGNKVLLLTNSSWAGRYYVFEVEEGKKYTFSVDVLQAGDYTQFTLVPSNWAQGIVTGSVNVIKTSGYTAGIWSRKYCVFECTQSGKIVLVLETKGSIPEVKMAAYKLEEGENTAPRWTPSTGEMVARSIVKVTEYYKATATNSSPPTTTAWTTDATGIPNKDFPYLWNYEMTDYSDGTYDTTEPHLLMIWTQDGAAGKGISAITNYYAVSASRITAPSTWEAAPPETDETNRYLWNYERIDFTDGSHTETDKRIIGVHGKDGKDGAGYSNNLLLKSNVPVSSSAYRVANYLLAETPEEGEYYTITIWGELAATKTEFGIWNTNSMIKLAGLEKIGNGVYNAVFKWINRVGSTTVETPTQILVYATTSTQTGTSSISRIKLEKGSNSSPQWCPAASEMIPRVPVITGNAAGDILVDGVSIGNFIGPTGGNGAKGDKGDNGSDGKDGANYTPNLLSGTRTWAGFTAKGSGGGIFPFSIEGFSVLFLKDTAWKGNYHTVNISAGKKYTFSVTVMTTGDNAQLTVNPTWGSQTSQITEIRRNTISGNTTRLYVCFECTKGGSAVVCVEAKNGNDVNFYAPKLEEGENTSPEWTPATGEMIGKPPVMTLDTLGNLSADGVVLGNIMGPEGQPGESVTGPEGAVKRGPAPWMEGAIYYNGSGTTASTKFLDYVEVRDSYGNRAIYQCKRSHQATAAKAPTTTGGEEYWTAVSNIGPLYASTFFAPDAKIDFLTSQEIVLRESEGNITGRLGGGSVPFYLGGETNAEATFELTDKGKARFGERTGERVEIDPRNKSIEIFNSSQKRVILIHGEGRTLEALTKNASGASWTINHQSSNLNGKNNATETVEAATITTTSSGRTSVTVKLKVLAQEQYRDNGSSTTMAQLYMATATAKAYIVNNTTGAVASGCQQEISVSSLYSGTDSRELNVEFTPFLISGNTYKLKIDLTLRGGGGKVLASAEFSNVTGSNTVASNYHADFFGNGLIISSQSNDMLMAAHDDSAGMTVQMENKNGHGIRVNNEGVMMKHHGGVWCYVPELVFSCNCNFSGTTMTPAGLYSFDNSSSSILQVKRTGVGIITVTFPENWVTKLGAANFSSARWNIQVLGVSSPVIAVCSSLTSSGMTLKIFHNNVLTDTSVAIRCYLQRIG